MSAAAIAYAHAKVTRLSLLVDLSSMLTREVDLDAFTGPGDRITGGVEGVDEIAVELR